MDTTSQPRSGKPDGSVAVEGTLAVTGADVVAAGVLVVVEAELPPHRLPANASRPTQRISGTDLN
jgi:hypothetical protein